MHLLKAQPGTLLEGSEPVDLAQSPGDIVVLSAADTEIAALARAHDGIKQASSLRIASLRIASLRLASLNHLSHNYSVDLYIEQTLRHAKLIILRQMGGTGYWRYGLDEVVRLARGAKIHLAVMPGDHRPDPSLDGLSTLEAKHVNRLWAYLAEGGPDNMSRFLEYCAHILNNGDEPAPASPLPLAGLFKPGQKKEGPCAAIVFYRALVQAGDAAPIEALISALEGQGLNPLPIYVSSLKDTVAVQTLSDLFDEAKPDIVINCTGFAVSKPGQDWSGAVLDAPGAPVLQAVLASIDEDTWEQNRRGLNARDIAMNVSLPEIDGRILTRAISFKAQEKFDNSTQSGLVVHKPRPDRIDFVAKQARNWVLLRSTKASKRRIAIVLSNYPSSDGRIANGVGLDTPASTCELLRAMKEAGYSTGDLPDTGGELMALLQQGPTNAGVADRKTDAMLPLQEYSPDKEITERWGAPEKDHFFIAEENSFAIPAHSFGEIVVAVQPSRGYNLDPRQIHHDPDLPPPHGYAAFYFWLREVYGAHAIIHMGKHGNLEWLPGKALALSDKCWPESLLGPLPHIYPFIANDPGEGTQAKRRTSAVIISHLTPPLTRAETYGPLKDLEALVDEYYQAAGVDPRRLKLLTGRIIDMSLSLGLDKDCGFKKADSQNDQLEKLDNYLCELKELQIRDGLHIFGKTPDGDQLDNLLLALLRIPRDDGKGKKASLIRALASDLGLDGFDPLNCRMSENWSGEKPKVLQKISDQPWRSNGDTVERLEMLALQLVSGQQTHDADWHRTCEVLDGLKETVRPRVKSCGQLELDGALTALDGRFLQPGPSGAPTRGRLDVLPTGRNFFSIDSRTVPTETAWELGRKSADLLVTAYFQEHGEWPRQFGLSAWGTSNMRTGGDDIAQALALIGARPVWDSASRRVTGFEIMKLSELNRPRIDVLFRISGFFRDAFPAQINLLDSAIRAIAALDEPAEANPLKDAARIFSSKPGGYGAGVQTLIESSAWEDEADLAGAYMKRGEYSYSSDDEGKKDGALFADLLKKTDAVVHNQDAREFDLLDSDDFYDFEGGMAAAISHLKGKRPAIYHNDHSRPESPRIRKLEEEIAMIVRGRAANPKWIASMKRHGYKGAADMAQSVTNLFAFAATTGAVENHHFEMLFEAYMIDPETRDFLERANPAALADMAARFLEASSRDLWRPRRNSAMDFLEGIKNEQ